MLQDAALIALGLVALFFGGTWLVNSAGRLASAFGVSPLVIGLTVVAFGTSVPELLVALDAALSGVSDIALGNVVGSNIANIGLILGITAIIYPLTVNWSILRRETPIMITASVVALLMALDGSFNLIDGLILFAGFIAFNAFMFVSARRNPRELEPELTQYTAEQGLRTPEKVNRLIEAGRLIVGLLLLIVGADWTVDGAVAIARGFGISEFIIGVTLVAFGTSLPELTTSIIGALRRETDIVVGNVIGSNIANLLLILGVTSIIRPIPVNERIISLDLLVMIGFALALLPLLRRARLGRVQGTLLSVTYTIFIFLTTTM